MHEGFNVDEADSPAMRVAVSENSVSLRRMQEYTCSFDTRKRVNFHLDRAPCRWLSLSPALHHGRSSVEINPRAVAEQVPGDLSPYASPHHY
jgi:hypothetical protein